MSTRAEYVTKPREQIVGILRSEPRFLTAAEIHRALEQADARVSLSTVYRTLEHLRVKGDITERTDEAGESTFMLCEPAHHHHHAICRVCGRVEDVSCAALGAISASLKSNLGFELESHNMEFLGKCSTCR